MTMGRLFGTIQHVTRLPHHAAATWHRLTYRQPCRADVERDIEALMWSADLARLRRFHNQPFWEAEGKASDMAAELEGPVRLESVADHSWKVADAAILLAGHFRWLDRSRVVELAILHDKLELITGDLSPIDADGTGRSTHAFNEREAENKARVERDALGDYVGTLRKQAAADQFRLLLEIIDGSTPEARFVKAVDKLAALVFVIQAKRAPLAKTHVEFTTAYTTKAVTYFPPLALHHAVLMRRFIDRFRLSPGPVSDRDGKSEHARPYSAAR